jgi:hypothetical protein
MSSAGYIPGGLSAQQHLLQGVLRLPEVYFLFVEQPYEFGKLLRGDGHREPLLLLFGVHRGVDRAGQQVGGIFDARAGGERLFQKGGHIFI